jgi:hypothetical protein
MLRWQDNCKRIHCAHSRFEGDEASRFNTFFVGVAYLRHVIFWLYESELVEALLSALIAPVLWYHGCCQWLYLSMFTNVRTSRTGFAEAVPTLILQRPDLARALTYKVSAFLHDDHL